MRATHLSMLGFSCLLTLAACSSTPGDPIGTGGSPPVTSGGATTTAGGGATAKGGSSSSGGSANGGTTATSSGGSSSGGATSSGGTSSGGTASGGALTGGTTANGGKTGTGATTSGGSSGSGGGSSTGSGGKTGTGGMASGGSSSGGATSGGNTATGGSGGGTAPGPSGMPVPAGGGNVPKPSGTFSKVTVLNWAGFKAAVSYSFDDNNPSQINSADGKGTDNYDKMKALGVHYTYYMWTGQASASNAVWSQAFKDGHEIGNHTSDHAQNPSSAAATDSATQFIKDKFGAPPRTMAAPYGTGTYGGYAKTRFIINRGVSNNLIGAGASDSTDPFNLPTHIPNSGQSTADFNTQVDQARSAGKWRTMCIHGFDTRNGTYQPVSIDNFIAHVKKVQEYGDVWIDSMVNVGSYWLGQKAFEKGMSAGSGSDTTITWKLPDNFPPGHYLRVKVDGGTLKQNGATLNWDSHGWYEIALDAQSLTVSP